MTLPTINPARIQRNVSELEADQQFKTFDELCKAVSNSDWGKQFGLIPSVVAELIKKHEIKTDVSAPESSVSEDDETESTEVKTFSEGGRGRKQCPDCEAYVGVRVSQCKCGHAFQSKSGATPKLPKEKKPVSSEPTEVKTFSEGGRGRKQCPDCSLYVGAISAKCKCGHVFKPKDKSVVAEKQPKDLSSIKTYTEAGQGRKHCPKCSCYVGVRNPQCACGYVFQATDKAAPKQKDPSEIKTYSQGGQGRKECPDCNVYVGARVPQCPKCNHVFPNSSSYVAPASDSESDSENVGLPLHGNIPAIFIEAFTEVPPDGLTSRHTKIAIPSGNCPHRLSNIDKDSVLTWAEKCRNHFVENDQWLTVRALKFFSRQFVEMINPLELSRTHGTFSEEYKNVCEIIEEAYA